MTDSAGLGARVGVAERASLAETARLDRVAAWYDPRHDFDRHACLYGASVIRRHAVPGTGLEVACGTGAQTLALLEAFDSLDAFDGSEQNVERTFAAVMAAASAAEKTSRAPRPPARPAIDITHALAEEFDPGPKRYANIVMTHFLEHVASPVAILRRFASFLADGGAIHVTVPNAGSLHRKIGVAMGMLAKPADLNERDVRLGHRRVYTPSRLRRHVRAAGLRVDRLEGILLKPLSNAQMEGFDPRLVDALFVVGRDHREMCAEIYVRCRAR